MPEFPEIPPELRRAAAGGSAGGGGEADRSRLWNIAGMGGELTGAIVGMLLMGWLADHLMKTAPTLTIAGGLIGLVGGGYNFLRRAMALNREEVAKLRRAHPQGLAPLHDADAGDEADRDRGADQREPGRSP